MAAANNNTQGDQSGEVAQLSERMDRLEQQATDILTLLKLSRTSIPPAAKFHQQDTRTSIPPAAPITRSAPPPASTTHQLPAPIPAHISIPIPNPSSTLSRNEATQVQQPHHIDTPPNETPPAPQAAPLHPAPRPPFHSTHTSYTPLHSNIPPANHAAPHFIPFAPISAHFKPVPPAAAHLHPAPLPYSINTYVNDTTGVPAPLQRANPYPFDACIVLTKDNACIVLTKDNACIVLCPQPGAQHKPQQPLTLCISSMDSVLCEVQMAPSIYMLMIKTSVILNAEILEAIPPEPPPLRPEFFLEHVHITAVTQRIMLSTPVPTETAQATLHLLPLPNSFAAEEMAKAAEIPPEPPPIRLDLHPKRTFVKIRGRLFLKRERMMQETKHFQLRKRSSHAWEGEEHGCTSQERLHILTCSISSFLHAIKCASTHVFRN